MSIITLLSIVILKIVTIEASYLKGELEFEPKVERNNVVNKGVWMKNKLKEYSGEPASAGNFIFRASSLEIDNVLHNNFDVFEDNNMQDGTIVSSYITRARRSPNDKQTERSYKSLKTCLGKDCNTTKQPLKSKFINDLKPASVFNDYPYEVAVLLKNHENNHSKNKTNIIDKEITEIGKDSDKNTAVIPLFLDKVEDNTNMTSKRSTKYDFETELVKKFEFTEDINTANDSKISRDVILDNENKAWPPTNPAPSEIYKVLPKEPHKTKPVTERGLLKVITMLTKTFKKVMKQHSEVKEICNKLGEYNYQFHKKSDIINKQFEEFETKYAAIKKFHSILNTFENKLRAEEDYFKTKEREIANSLTEFAKAQKQFLTQQRNFYDIQKLILAQNEKINIKQSLIAKSQNDISLRQNNFARILKKAKQFFVENKNEEVPKIKPSLPKEEKKYETTTEHIQTTVEQTDESVKINLLSHRIPEKITNHDELIIKEKDDQPIDDLIYKYYFNNTFIDALMKSKVLNNLVGFDNNLRTRYAKTKRNELKTTILLPVKDNNVTGTEINRARRWVNHSRRRNKRKNRGKNIVANNTTDEKRIGKNSLNDNQYIADNGIVKSRDLKDPFVMMANSFCKGLNPNMKPQIMDWCIEKTLRRLKHIDTAIFTSSATPQIKAKQENFEINTKEPNIVTNIPKKGSYVNPKYDQMVKKSLMMKKSPMMSMPPMAVMMSKFKSDGMKKGDQPVMTDPVAKELTTGLMTKETMYTTPVYLQKATIFFPDNEELESNLKQYEIVSDTDGNVYYDGSLHASDLEKLNTGLDSGFVNDFMPGLDSNSKLHIDPAYGIQAQRHAYARRVHEHMKRPRA